jgi:hypothetical protein
MLYQIIGTIPSENYKATMTRFLETGGPPPEGVKMLSRHVPLDAGRVFVLCEADDPLAVVKWANEWVDLGPYEIIPVVTGEDFAAAIS